MSKEKSRQISRRQFLGLGMVGLGGMAVWQWNEVDHLVVERSQLTLPRWKADGFKIAMLADLHSDTLREGKRAARAVRMALAEKPDVCVLSGDYISAEGDEPLQALGLVLEALGESAVPVFAVLGNHDYWVSSTRKIIDGFSGHNVRVLRNEAADVRGVSILGIDDGLMQLDRHDVLTDQSDSGSVVALLHEPDFVRRVDRRVGLMLSGHSHGGQICLPGGVPVHTPIGAIRYRTGYYADARVPLYVTRGVGTVGPRKRAFCPPEVSLLTLKSG